MGSREVSTNFPSNIWGITETKTILGFIRKQDLLDCFEFGKIILLTNKITLLLDVYNCQRSQKLKKII